MSNSSNHNSSSSSSFLSTRDARGDRTFIKSPAITSFAPIIVSLTPVTFATLYLYIPSLHIKIPTPVVQTFHHSKWIHTCLLALESNFQYTTLVKLPSVHKIDHFSTLTYHAARISGYKYQEQFTQISTDDDLTWPTSLPTLSSVKSLRTYSILFTLLHLWLYICNEYFFLAIGCHFWR